MAQSDTKARMIQTAVGLFQRHGYYATSWRELVQEAGTPWGSVHHHFPGGKEELAVAAIAAGGDGVAGLIASCQQRSTSPGDAVRRLFHASATILANSGYAEGCPIAPVALDTADTGGAIPAACAAGIEGWTRLVADHLASAGTPTDEADNVATLVVAAFEGSLLLAKLQRSTTPMENTGRQLHALIDGLHPAPSADRTAPG
jgi:AcrR family transcriptional regulator